MQRERFAPGTLLAGRYRIVARLGKGGMGEVFRADDLILGQPVALKFLPETAKSNVNLLTRFYDEVRIARQIAHPNVCRVYDIGEVEGQPYLSMEYIDGEDLGVLLRRIGRLPNDKACEFARKLCAGVAAAHSQGVLHRDLKPGNIMVDARGDLKITDFGLAAVAEQLQGAEIRNGTPAYMAPEQLTGTEVSAQSDIYALGLVFFEMFTGKAAFRAETVGEVLRLRQEGPSTNPSTLVPDLDASVERAILRCLNPDPRQRPASALTLAASLPGGDPLLAALAAGETPSPEVVAASGSTEGLNPKLAMLACAGILVLLVGFCLTKARQEVATTTPLEFGPDVLTIKARDLVRALGYPEPFADSASGFKYDADYLEYVADRAKGPAAISRFLSGPPLPFTFWYRQSPLPLVSERTTDLGRVTRTDPVQDITGMLSLITDSEGRLLSFNAVPPQLFEKDPPNRAAPDWKMFFRAAQLDPAAFQTASPQWTPLAAMDSRSAWTGTYPGRPDMPVRVEAASFHGRAVYFAVIGPWTKAYRIPGVGKRSAAQIASEVGSEAVFVLSVLAAILFAIYNWKAGRVDHRGALRLAVFIAAVSLVGWALSAHHVADRAEQRLFWAAVAQAAYQAVLYWTVYLAIEPWVRRYWPQSLITWSRILSGRIKDPMVGRDVLVGLLLGLFYACLFVGSDYWNFRAGGAPSSSFLPDLLSGPRFVGWEFAAEIVGAITFSIRMFMCLFLLRVLLRKQWLAASTFVLIFTSIEVSSSTTIHFGIFGVLLWVLIWSVIVLIMLRFGLFAMITLVFVAETLEVTYLNGDFTAWYGFSSLAIVMTLIGLAAWGFRYAVPGPIFGGLVPAKQNP